MWFTTMNAVLLDEFVVRDGTCVFGYNVLYIFSVYDFNYFLFHVSIWKNEYRKENSEVQSCIFRSIEYISVKKSE